MIPRFAAFAALALFSSVHTLLAQRETQELATGWKFLKQDTTADAKSDTWEAVTIPHTWNAVDGANGKAAEPQYPEGYYRGPAWYARPLDLPADWKTKRVFIRFEGVSLVADVFINGIPIGQHRGAFAAFCYEITPFLRFDGKDTLKVRADNARTFDVAPLSGDFTVFGGIYRPVKLIATDQVCISPLEFGSPGVFATLKELTRDRASIEVKALISARSGATASAFEMEIKDADGKVIDSGITKAHFGSATENSLTTTLAVPNPRLWQGRKDPYLYTATVRVHREGKATDEVTQTFGIRTVALTQERGFLLNGDPYPLHGVNRHQDRAERGWALSDADQEEDHAMIVEMGATTIRLAHYQQAEKVHELSDRAGMIEWQEIPLVDTVGGSPEFLENAGQQLREMILQSWNHPSIAMWGLYNELDANWAAVKTAPAVPVIENLKKLARELDPSRPTIAASWMQNPTPLHSVPDWVAWNIYPGWYGGMPDDATTQIAGYSDKLGGKRIGISEYGAGANALQFQETDLKPPKDSGPFHPQEWQNVFHERLWAQMKDNPRLFGTWVWVMFDFAIDKRNEGSTPGINDKGLVTRDRKIRKDTFYFYKANWNAEPMVHIASRRMTPRKVASTTVKVYSNCPEVELKVNGQSLGKAKPDEVRICRWENVVLTPGVNRIEAVSLVENREISDSCEWVLEAAAPAER